MKKDELEDSWIRTRALSPASIGKAIMHERVLGVIRREIRKDIGLSIDPEDLASGIQKMWSLEVREMIGPVRIRKRRTRRASGRSHKIEPRTSSEKFVSNQEARPTGGKPAADVE